MIVTLLVVEVYLVGFKCLHLILNRQNSYSEMYSFKDKWQIDTASKWKIFFSIFARKKLIKKSSF